MEGSGFLKTSNTFSKSEGNITFFPERNVNVSTGL
jgi:hypothetical protein